MALKDLALSKNGIALILSAELEAQDIENTLAAD